MAASRRKAVIPGGSCIERENDCRSCNRDRPRLPAYRFCNDCKRPVCEGCCKYHTETVPTANRSSLQRECVLPTEQLSTLSVHSSESDVMSPEGASSLDTRQPSPPGKICVAAPEDECSSWITGMVILYPYRIVITDYNNRCLKMTNICNDHITDRVRLNGRPWDVAIVKENEVAITLPDEKKIQFVVASSNKLRKKRILRVSEKYWGISNCRSKLIVSLKSPPQLQIIDLKGDILKTIYKSWSGDNIFSCPHFIKTNSSFIYVSDRDKKKIFVLNYRSQVVSSYGTSAAPRGIAVSEAGIFCVSVSSEGENGNVLEISGNGSKRLLTLRHLNDPYALCMHEEDKDLYISTFSGSEKLDNFLRVYKI